MQWYAIEKRNFNQYKQAHKISKQEAKKAIARRNGDMDDFNIKDYLEGDLTDDGEINQ